MSKEVIHLSPVAFKLLNLLYYNHITSTNLKASIAHKILQTGRDTYNNALYELKEANLLYIQQAGPLHYIYILGHKAIKDHKNKWDNKHTKTYKVIAEEYFGKSEIPSTSGWSTITNKDGDDFNIL